MRVVVGPERVELLAGLVRQHGEVAGVDADGTELGAGHLDGRGDPGRDVVGVDQQGGADPQRLDLGPEGVALVLVQQGPRVCCGAGGGHAVAAAGREVGRGREPRQVGGPGGGDGGLLVGAPRAHLDARPGARRVRPAVHRDGLSPHPRGIRSRRGPGRLSRGVRGHVQPGSRPGTEFPGRHGGARLDAAHEREGDAFRSQIEALGVATTLLVDTYNIAAGIATAIEVAGPARWIRIDSGDLAAVLAHQARARLDKLGAQHTRIVLSGDLDEFGLAALAPRRWTPTGSAPPWSPARVPRGRLRLQAGRGQGCAVAKRSEDKSTRGGRKTAVRRHRSTGTATEEVVRPQGEPSARAATARSSTMVRGGTLSTSRPGRLPGASSAGAHQLALQVSPVQGQPAIPTTYEEPPMHRPRRVLDHERARPMVVDVQNDFADPAGGSTCGTASRSCPWSASRGRRAAAARPSHTQDWHPRRRRTSKDGGVWPVHCVPDTWGAELHPALLVRVRGSARALNGEDGYSGFSTRDPITGDHPDPAAVAARPVGAPR